MDFRLSDLGNARRLVEVANGKIRWCEPENAWYIWDGKRWCRDETLQVHRYIKQSVQVFRQIAMNMDDEDEEMKERIINWCCRSESASSLKASDLVARSEEGVPITPASLDRQPWHLNCRNGIVDLTSGDLMDHRPEMMMTKMTACDYKPKATCPRWEEFVSWAMNDDEEMTRFLHTAVGYSITASTREQVLFFVCGQGANGKSTFMNTVRKVIGSYSTQAAPNLLMAQRSDQHPSELADLRGARLVSAFEVDKGRRWAEAKVKQLTGQDPVKARHMHQDWFTYQPVCKIWISANTKPFVSGTDHAIWRRILLIPFDRTPTHVDNELPSKLWKEREGILAWAIRGCQEWQKSGLHIPTRVHDSTQDYRAEQDVIGLFLTEETQDDPGAAVAVSMLYQRYRSWCQNAGEEPVSRRALSHILKERGYRPGRNAKARLWKGLTLTRRLEEPYEHSPNP